MEWSPNLNNDKLYVWANNSTFFLPEHTVW